MKGEGIRWLLFVLDFMWRTIWIPAFAGMTVIEGGNDGGQSERRRNDSLIEFSVNLPMQVHKGRGNSLTALGA